MFYLFANVFVFYIWNKTVLLIFNFIHLFMVFCANACAHSLLCVSVCVLGSHVEACGQLFWCVFPNNFLNSLFEHYSTKPEHTDLESSCFYLPSAEITLVCHQTHAWLFLNMGSRDLNSGQCSKHFNVWAISRSNICLFFLVLLILMLLLRNTRNEKSPSIVSLPPSSERSRRTKG